MHRAWSLCFTVSIIVNCYVKGNMFFVFGGCDGGDDDGGDDFDDGEELR